MNKALVAVAIAGSLAVSLSAFANKGANYEPHHKHHDNLDWSKGWYIGAGVNGNSQGTMNLNGTPEVFEHDLSGSDVETEMDSEAIGFDVYVGRQISKHWAAELGYTWLGTQNFDFETDEVDTYDIEVNQWNVHLVGIGKLPVGEYVNFFVKGGAAYFSSTQEFESDPEDESSEFTDTTHTMALTYGVGAEFAMHNWGIRGEYNVLWPATNVRDDFYIADIISANVYYKFD